MIKIKKCIVKFLYLVLIVYISAFIPVLWGHKPLVVLSGSMEPTLKVGGLLYYQKQDFNKFKNNDILVYKSKKHIISHRIIARSNNYFKTKGDANNTIDSMLINKKYVLGKGTNWSIPLMGYYTDFIYRHKYLLYLFSFILLLDLYIDIHIKKYKVGDMY